MGAEVGVNILWHVFPIPRPVLGPVGEVAHHLGGRSCDELDKVDKNNNWSAAMLQDEVSWCWLVDM